MSAPRVVRDVSLRVLLHFLARGRILGLSEQGSPPLPCSLLHRLILSSPSSIGALSSSTGATSGLTGASPIVVTVVPARVLSGPASQNSTHPLRQLVSLPTSRASKRCALDGGL